MSEIREEVLWFAERMECKLKANDHKSHWIGCDPFWLWERMDEEARELHDTLPNEPWRLTDEERDQIIDECADVANFAMMIADNARRIPPSPSSDGGTDETKVKP